MTNLTCEDSRVRDQQFFHTFAGENEQTSFFGVDKKSQAFVKQSRGIFDLPHVVAYSSTCDRLSQRCLRNLGNLAFLLNELHAHTHLRRAFDDFGFILVILRL